MTQVQTEGAMDGLDGLVIAARQGGDWALARIWTELSGPVAGYLRARGVVDVDDVTSEVFLAAFQGLPSFVGEGERFRAWLFTIAHHRSVDAARQRSRRAAETPFDVNRDDRSSASAEDAVLLSEQTDATIQLLNLLTPDQREVVLLRFVADLSLEQVAAITGRKIGAVKQLQRRGIDALRRHLNGATSPGPVSRATLISIAESR